MAHVVSGKLRKQPFTKDNCGQDGQSKMYIAELAEVNKDYQTGEKQYTNYKAMFFAKTPNARQLYDQIFVEGSFIVCASEKLKVDQFQADNGTTYITLMMDNARLESFLTAQDMGASPQQPQPQQQGGWGQPQQPQPQQPPQQNYNQAPQQQMQQPQQPGGNPADFDDDIPFGYIGIQNRNIVHCM